MNILRVVTLLSGSGKSGGPMTTSINQLRTAREAGHNVLLFGAHLLGDAPDPREAPAGIRILTHSARPLIPKLSLSTIFSSRIAAGVIRHIRAADVIHVAAARDFVILWTMFLALLLRRPVVAQPHGMIQRDGRRFVRVIDMLALRPLMKRCTSIICLTQREADEVAHWLGATVPITIIGNGVDVADLASRSVPTQARTKDEAIFIARLAARKRVDVFCEAAAHAEANLLRGRYVVVGPDSGTLGVVQEASSRLPQRRLVYEGAIPPSQVLDRLARSRVFVLTSEAEPWGVVLVQALGLGIPVVVTASSALAELVNDYGAGAVVPDADPRRISESVHELLTNSELYEEAASSAFRASREHLDRNILNVELLKVYSNARSA